MPFISTTAPPRNWLHSSPGSAGFCKQEAVHQAVQAELLRMMATIPLRERIAAWRKQHRLPPPTGQAANKAFFDELSGKL